MHLITLYPDGDLIQVALLHLNKQTITVKSTSSISIKEANVKSFDIVRAALGNENAEIISGLDATQVFVRDIHLKLSSNRAIVSALPFQLEALLPFPLDQVVLIPLIKKNKKEATLSIFAADHQSIEHHLALVKQHSVEPDQVSCAPKALLRLGEHSFPDISDLLFFHLGNEKSLYGASVEKQLRIAQPFRWGLVHFLDAVKKDLPNETIDPTQFDLLDLDKERTPALFALTLQFQRDLDRMSAFLQKKYSCNTLLLTGHLSHHFNLKTFIKHSLGPSMTFLSPKWEGEQISTVETYAVPFGLALDHMTQDNTSLQFRQGTFTHPKAFKKKLRLLTGSILCVLLFGIGFWAAEQLLLIQKKTELLRIFQCSSGLEKEEDLNAGMDKWEKALSEKTNSFPYQLTAPKVSDVLHWLSTHPKFSSKNLKEKIEIKGFDYTLTKYPKLPTEKSPYVAKVELEFTASSPRFAREFHDALIKDEEMVNAQAETTWNVNQTLYRSSFFLKNKVGE